ncbi:MAG: YraN family protein [Bifidobacteriaceae bacterium]|jgi:putative endonuclease|nr:YraN family protein [Bifidobacteriaceae bacterium]
MAIPLADPATARTEHPWTGGTHRVGPEPCALCQAIVTVRHGGNQELGRCGEDVARDYLEHLGFEVLDRNWRGRDGEIDIVALDPAGALVIVEVKARRGLGFGSPAQAVTHAKYQRLRRLAAQWVEAHRVRAPEIRIDVLGVVFGPHRVEVEHLEGVFR